MRKKKMCVCCFCLLLKYELNQEDGGTEMRAVSILRLVSCSSSKCRFVPASCMADVFFRLLVCLLVSFLADHCNYVWRDSIPL